MRYQVRLRGAAAKEYRGLSETIQQRVLEALLHLEQEPIPHGAKSLSGQLQGLHRIRVGDYRIVYQIDDADHTVSVVRIRPRGRAYR